MLQMTSVSSLKICNDSFEHCSRPCNPINLPVCEDDGDDWTSLPSAKRIMLNKDVDYRSMVTASIQQLSPNKMSPNAFTYKPPSSHAIWRPAPVRKTLIADFETLTMKNHKKRHFSPVSVTIPEDVDEIDSELALFEEHAQSVEEPLTRSMARNQSYDSVTESYSSILEIPKQGSYRFVEAQVDASFAASCGQTVSETETKPDNDTDKRICKSLEDAVQLVEIMQLVLNKPKSMEEMKALGNYAVLVQGLTETSAAMLELDYAQSLLQWIARLNEAGYLSKDEKRVALDVSLLHLS
jgi:hypothetical protein